MPRHSGTPTSRPVGSSTGRRWRAWRRAVRRGRHRLGIGRRLRGRDFQPSHLTLAIKLMTGLADALDDRLQGDFGGRRFFDAAALRPALPDSVPGTGMYL